MYVVLVLLLLSLLADCSDNVPRSNDNGTSPSVKTRFQVFSFNWDHVRVPLGIGFWLLFATLVKIGFHLSEQFSRFIPFSSMLILLGLAIGGFLYLMKLLTHSYEPLLTLSPTLFFLYLLPPIVFEAGYFMPARAFYDNLGTILVYAVLGTLWNVFAIGLSLYGLSFTKIFSVETSLLDLLLFGSIISAVDPVAVLVVFEEVHVNELLYICVFGESLLNDAVTVVSLSLVFLQVLYHMFESFSEIGSADLKPVDIAAGVLSFFIVGFGGLFVGLISALLTAFMTKYTDHLRVVQPLICLLFPYLAYLLAEMVHVSGILATVLCAMLMKPYVKQNISSSSNTTVSYFLKTLTSICETIIFIFLGISTVSQAGHLDWWFMLCTLSFCLIYRFIGVFALSGVMNRFRLAKLSVVDQFIMAYGGLRGAVAYGMAASLLGKHLAPAKMYLATTIVVILFTVFVMGMTIKPMVDLLHVKRQEKRDRTMTERIFISMTDHAMSGVEEIAGIRGSHYIKDLFRYLNASCLHPSLVRGDFLTSYSNLVDKFHQMTEQEAREHLRKHGSLGGKLSLGGGTAEPEVLGDEQVKIEQNEESVKFTVGAGSPGSLEVEKPSQEDVLSEEEEAILTEKGRRRVRFISDAPEIANEQMNVLLNQLYRGCLSASANERRSTRRYSRHVMEEDLAGMRQRAMEKDRRRLFKRKEEGEDEGSPVHLRPPRVLVDTPPPFKSDLQSADFRTSRAESARRRLLVDETTADVPEIRVQPADDSSIITKL